MGVGETGVGETGQIIGEMGVGETGVGETGTNLFLQVNLQVSQFQQNNNFVN